MKSAQKDKTLIIDSRKLKFTLQSILDKYEPGRWDIVTAGYILQFLPSDFHQTFEESYDIDDGFNERWVSSADTSETQWRLRRELADASKVYIATSPGLEGETDAWRIACCIGMPNQLRVTINEISYRGVTDAIENARTLDRHAVEAGRARHAVACLLKQETARARHFFRDGITGLRCAEVFRMLIERQREYEFADDVEQFYVNCSYRRNNGGSWDVTNHWELAPEAKARLDASGSSGKTRKKQLKCEIQRLLNEAFWTRRHVVRSIDFRRHINCPPTPMRTADLLCVMSREHAMDVCTTMSIAEWLFHHGYITYPYTDATYICRESVDDVRSIIKRSTLARFLDDQPTAAAKCRLGQEAIRPVAMVQHPQGLRPNHDAHVLYDEIFLWTLLSQLKPSIYTEATFAIDIDGTEHQITGQQKYVTQDGWKEAEQWPIMAPFRGEYGNSTITAIKTPEELELNVGRELECERLSFHVKEPDRPRLRELFEYELIDHFEKNKLIRSCHVPALFSTLELVMGIKCRRSRYLGTKVIGIDDNPWLHSNDTLHTAFDEELCSVHAIATLEEQLNGIAQGTRDRVGFLKEFYERLLRKMPNSAALYDHPGKVVPMTVESRP